MSDKAYDPLLWGCDEISQLTFSHFLAKYIRFIVLLSLYFCLMTVSKKQYGSLGGNLTSFYTKINKITGDENRANCLLEIRRKI